jgi:hypothetical protein
MSTANKSILAHTHNSSFTVLAHYDIMTLTLCLYTRFPLPVRYTSNKWFSIIPVLETSYCNTVLPDEVNVGMPILFSGLKGYNIAHAPSVTLEWHDIMWHVLDLQMKLNCPLKSYSPGYHILCTKSRFISSRRCHTTYGQLAFSAWWSMNNGRVLNR